MVLIKMTYSLLRHCKSRSTILKNCRSNKRFHDNQLSESMSAATQCQSLIQRRYAHVLGIETSCDDTGAAIVDSDGNIIGNALHSQTSVSVA